MVDSITEVLKFQIEYDTKGAIRGLQAVDKEFMRSAKDITKAMRGMDKATMAGVEGARKGWSAWRQEVQASKHAIKMVDNEIKHLNRTYQQAQDTAKKGSTAEQTKARQEMKSTQARIKALNRVRNETEKLAKKTIKLKFVAFAGDIKKAFEGTNVFGKLLQKDIAGAFQAGGKLMGTIIEGSMRSLSAGTGPGVGKAMRKFAGRQALAGKQRKGAAGAVQFAGAKGIVGLSKMMGKFSKVAGVLAKIGPLVAGLASALVGVVKLMLDAEAAAKDFNKQILTSASTGKFLTANANNADIAFAKLDGTMKSLRDDAFSLSNLKMGISKAEHIAFTNVLTQEGVELYDLSEEFKSYQKSAGAATRTVMNFQQATMSAVAYSRAFGVSLNEIGSFQADLMSNMAMSAGEVGFEFEKMKMAAGDSGIAFNKFFGMIRGISSDLALWNVRMGDAVKLLGKIGKAMSPRTAQEFFNTAMKGLKGMGRLERLRLTLLAGPKKVAGAVQRDIKRKTSGIAGKIAGVTGGDTGALEAQIRDRKVSTSEILKGVPEAMVGELTEAIIRTRTQDSMASKGGPFATAMAARTLGPGASLEVMQDALSRFAGGAKTLMDARGSIGAEMMAENLGISEEQLDQMVIFEQVMEDFRTQEMKNNPEEAKKIQTMAYDELFDRMEPDQKKVIEEMGDTRSAAEKQGDLMTSMLDKLGIIVDFMMNQIYNAMMGIWDAILQTVGDEADRTGLEVGKSGRKDLIDLWKASGGDVEKYKKAAIESGGGVAVRSTLRGTSSKVEGLNAREAELGTAIGNAQTPEAKAKLEAELKAVQLEKQTLQDQYRNIYKAVSTDIDSTLTGVGLLGGESGVTLEGQQRIRTAGQASGIGGDQLKKLVTGISTEEGESAGIESAMSGAGLTDEQRGAFMSALFGNMSARQITGIIGDTTKMGPPGGAGAPGPAAAAATAANPSAPTAPAGSPAGSPGAAPSGQPSGAVTVPPATPLGAVAPTGSSRKSPAEDMLNGIHVQTMTASMKLEELHKDLRNRGVKLDKSQLDNDVSKVIEDSTLNAARVALLEYFLYSALAGDDPAGIIEKIRAGADPKEFGRDVMSVTQKKGEKGLMDFLGNPKKEKNAIGGTAMFVGPSGVASIARTPNNEGWAPIGPGETISPVGRGGGNNVSIGVNVSGGGGDIFGSDFQRYLKSHVTKWIQDHEHLKTVR